MTMVNSGLKWNESGFRPPLCTYRLNWARRTSWGWWDDWDDTVLQTQDSKFEPWRSEAEHATSRSRRLPTILTFTRGWGRNIFVSFKPPRPGTEPRTLAWKAAVLTTTLGPPPSGLKGLIWEQTFENINAQRFISFPITVLQPSHQADRERLESYSVVKGLKYEILGWNIILYSRTIKFHYACFFLFLMGNFSLHASDIFKPHSFSHRPPPPPPSSWMVYTSIIYSVKAWRDMVTGFLSHPVDTKHLYDICTMLAQRRRRWASMLQMLYNCLCLLGI